VADCEESSTPAVTRRKWVRVPPVTPIPTKSVLSM